MEKVVIGMLFMSHSVVGGLLGLFLGAGGGYVSSVMQKQKEEESNLGYDWPNVRQDPELMSILYAIKNVVGPEGQEQYFAVGKACDDILSLHKLICSGELHPRCPWSFRAWSYRRNVERAIFDLGEHCQHEQKRRHTSGALKTSSFAEYLELADNLYKMIKDCYVEINRELHGNYAKGRAVEEMDVPTPPAENQKSVLGSLFAQRMADYQQSRQNSQQVAVAQQ